MTKIWRSDKLESGICSLAFDRKCIARNKLYLGSLEGGIYAMDLKTWSEDESVKRIRGEFRFKSKSTVWQVSVLPQCREILLNSMGDGTLTLWNFESSLSSEKNLTDKNIEQFGKLKYIQNAILSQQPICSFDCHRIKEGFIVLSSIDQSIKVVVATQLKSMIY
ncbi:MAG: WD repeat-containing protein 92 [Marteilia pararefringens]